VGVKTMRSLIPLHVQNKAYKYKNISQIHGHLSVANFVRGVLKHTYSSARGQRRVGPRRPARSSSRRRTPSAQQAGA
jgi:hypothetical protein